MKLYIAFHQGDLPLVGNQIRWINQLKSPSAHSLVLMADAGTDFYSSCILRDEAKQSFAEVTLDCTDREVAGWIPGSNALWLACAKHAQEHGADFWLFIEPDAVPLKPEWLSAIEADYLKGPGRFMGSIVRHSNTSMPSPYMEGCAVYPCTAWGEIKEVVGEVRSWTLETAAIVVPQARSSELFQHLWGERNLPPTFAKRGIQGTEVFGLDYLKPQAVLFHRNKDGTLIELLRERSGFKTPQRMVQRNHRMLTLRRTGAIGDVICASPIAERLLEQGIGVQFQAHEHTHCVLKRLIPQLYLGTPDSLAPQVNLDGAYENNPGRRTKHFSEMFFSVANAQLSRFGIMVGAPLNCTPRMVVEPNTQAIRLAAYARPWIFVCPKSEQFACRTVPNTVWSAASARINGTCFWIGRDPAPAGFVDLGVRHLDNLIQLLAHADLLATVDTGPMHIGAALNIPMVVINQSSFAEHHLSDQNDFITVAPPLGCLDCQKNTCPLVAPRVLPPCQNVPPELIADAVNRKLGGGNSAIISVYKPRLEQLNRCLDAVLPQVNEIIVCRDLAGSFPTGARNDPKIRYVICPKSDIGYGRKANFAARQSFGKWLWLLNDDCYVDPETLKRLQEAVTSQTGMIAHELRYLNGKIQHGGTYRNPGDCGWGHLDHNATVSRIKTPVEMENVTGASVLVRRTAFYQANGFDEQYYLYCEDNDLCLKIRKAGWKIMYTPHAKAIHEEHQSTSKTPNMQRHLQNSLATFRRKWSWYFERNKSTVPGTFV